MNEPQTVKPIDLLADASPTTHEDYTHAFIALTDGTRVLGEYLGAEIVAAQREMHAAALEKRAPFIVLHPIDGDGVEQTYGGTVVEITRLPQRVADRIRAEHEKQKEEAEQEQQRARLLTRGGLGAIRR